MPNKDIFIRKWII